MGLELEPPLPPAKKPANKPPPKPPTLPAGPARASPRLATVPVVDYAQAPTHRSIVAPSPTSQLSLLEDDRLAVAREETVFEAALTWAKAHESSESSAEKTTLIELAGGAAHIPCVPQTPGASPPPSASPAPLAVPAAPVAMGKSKSQAAAKAGAAKAKPKAKQSSSSHDSGEDDEESSDSDSD